MSTAEANQETRRVRPWIAALLTFLGWGVGLYYARRTRSAWLLAFASVFVGVAIGVAVIAYSIWSESVSALAWFDLINVPITVMVALGVWAATAKQRDAPKAGAVRLLGYAAVALVPILLSMIVAFAVRFAWAQPYRIPSGAMQPTLIVGDYVIVSKGAYGYSRYSAAPFESLFPSGRLWPKPPQRGDLVVFRPVPEPDRDFIKRIIGMPGDRVQMIGGVLHINGVAAARERRGVARFADEPGQPTAPAYRETLPNGVSYVIIERAGDEGALDDTPEFIVPPDHYFLMGDNRDNSADSRVPEVVGFVPSENLVGRVDHILRASD